MHTLGLIPDLVVVDNSNGGFSEDGIAHFSKELRKQVIPCLEKVVAMDSVKKGNSSFREKYKALLEGGTVGRLVLSDTEAEVVHQLLGLDQNNLFQHLRTSIDL